MWNLYNGLLHSKDDCQSPELSIINTTSTTSTFIFIQNFTALCFFHPRTLLCSTILSITSLINFQVLIEDVLWISVEQATLLFSISRSFSMSYSPSVLVCDDGLFSPFSHVCSWKFIFYTSALLLISRVPNSSQLFCSYNLSFEGLQSFSKRSWLNFWEEVVSFDENRFVRCRSRGW